MESLYTFEKKTRRERRRLGLPASVIMLGARRVSVSLLALLMALGGAACLFDSEESPSSTLAAVTTAAASVTTTTPPPTTSTPVTTAAVSVTTTTPPPTTSTTFPTQVIVNYLQTALTAEASIGQVVEEMITISNDWDNRSETDVTFTETEEAMDAAEERAQSLRADFELIQPPPTNGFPEEHRWVRAAAGQVADAASEMLAGLRSSDAGQQRQAAQVGLVAAFGVFVEAMDRVIAEFIGDEEITALIVSRNLTVPRPTGSDTTTTTESN